MLHPKSRGGGSGEGTVVGVGALGGGSGFTSWLTRVSAYGDHAIASGGPWWRWLTAGREHNGAATAEASRAFAQPSIRGAGSAACLATRHTCVPNMAGLSS